jgi:glycosyltransferase 2 family protein
MRRTLLFLAKVATSILLLYFSLRWVNVGALTERLGRLESGWIALALLLLMIQVALLAARWREIAAACGTNLAFGAALQFSFIATFFNQVLPSTIGGDGARIWFLARKGAGWAIATYSVLIDRIMGVFVLALIVIVCLPWTFELIHDPIARAVLLMMGCGAVAGTSIFLLIGTHFRQSLDRWPLARHLSAASRVAASLCGSRRASSVIFACSVAIHLLTIAAAWCCIKAIAAPVSFAQVLILLPPVLLISTIPISIAGWGVRESSMIAAFAYAGLAESDGLTLSILFGATIFVVGLAGGIVWIVSGLRIGPIAQVGDAEAIADNNDIASQAFEQMTDPQKKPSR